MVSVDSLQYGATAHHKRKTISQLKEEQLKRKKFTEIVHESPAPLIDSNKDNVGLRKPVLPRNPKYVETRLADVYKVKKSGLQTGKENAKLYLHRNKENHPVEKFCSVKKFPVLSNVPTNGQPVAGMEKYLVSSEAAKDDLVKCSATFEKCKDHTFRSVAELSLGKKGLSEQPVLDMGKALRGLAASMPPDFSSATLSSSKTRGDLVSMKSINLCPELTVPGRMTPLDLTLKIYIRLVSTSPVSWFHRSIMGSTYNGMPQCFTQKKDFLDKEVNVMAESSSDHQILKSKALFSWVYPQTSLPSSIIKALNLSAAEGAGIDFLSKRHSAWEDAFRCLYFMLRKNTCDIFYVCTAQFVVMFTSSPVRGIVKTSCKAYISRSTRGLRALLKEHDVCFSMPLSPSKMDEATVDDLMELSEMEKQNIGQTRRRGSPSHVDGTPKSLLAFDSNQNVHGLYDFLLNHKSLLFTLTSVDCPMLYSPVMFQNASMHAPEFQCKELKRLDSNFPRKIFDMKNGVGQETVPNSASCSIEVRDTYLPPWITCNLCAMMASEGGDFEASFTTEPTSAGLNFAVESLAEKSEEDKLECEKYGASVLGIADAFIAPEMCSAVLKGLKYVNNTTTASLSQV